MLIQGSKSIIFVLGGGAEREQFAAQFATLYPELEVWISGGMPIDWSLSLFRFQGILPPQLRFFAASNTVENFTSVLPLMQKYRIKHCFLITDAWHMKRATAIAFILFKLKGISYTPVPIFSPHKPASENWKKIIRDVVRAGVWLFLLRRINSRVIKVNS